jgi:hypothetical protein
MSPHPTLSIHDTNSSFILFSRRQLVGSKPLEQSVQLVALKPSVDLLDPREGEPGLDVVRRRAHACAKEKLNNIPRRLDMSDAAAILRR